MSHVVNEAASATQVEHAGVDVIAESARHGEPRNLCWPC